MHLDSIDPSSCSCPVCVLVLAKQRKAYFESEMNKAKERSVGYYLAICKEIERFNDPVQLVYWTGKHFQIIGTSWCGIPDAFSWISDNEIMPNALQK